MTSYIAVLIIAVISIIGTIIIIHKFPILPVAFMTLIVNLIVVTLLCYTLVRLTIEVSG